MSSLIASVEDGKIVETASQSSLSSSKTTSSDGMDKEAFLQLLVAQMKYQDPLEPTSNTEYIAQYAQFSQVEQMQNMASSMNLQRASSLVGQEVCIQTTSSSGEVNEIQGKVDYVVYESSKAYVSVDGQLYSIDDVVTVVDADYSYAVDLANAFSEGLDSLPAVNSVGLADEAVITTLANTYNNMTSYQKNFITSEQLASLEKYVDKLNELLEASKETEDTDGTENTKGTEDVEDTESTDDTEDNSTGTEA